MAKRKETYKRIWADSDWVVVPGKIIQPGRPLKISRLFQFVGEKLPYACLREVKAHVKAHTGKRKYGVYLAHDSFGVPRYAGRGDIFLRLARHKREFPKELQYFSFFIIKDEIHEHEIETAILHAASSEMTLNDRKVRTGLAVANITDYEPGTNFVERQNPRGPRQKKK